MVAKTHEVIARFGGQSALARALGVNQSTVQHWAKTGLIPSWRQEQVQRAAQDLGIPLPAGGLATPRGAAGKLPISAPPGMTASRGSGMYPGAAMSMARSAHGSARNAAAAPPAGQLGVPHGRADFTPNVEWEIGALRDEIGQLKGLVERLVGEVAALRAETAGTDDDEENSRPQRRSGKSKPRS